MTESEHNPTADRLKELLLWRTIESAEIEDDSPDGYSSGPVGYITLDDGKVLKVWGNDGGCGCAAGCYPLTELNACEGAITNVVTDENPDADYADYDGHYRVFVYSGDHVSTLASFDGSDGNGYYGTGWWMEVSE